MYSQNAASTMPRMKRVATRSPKLRVAAVQALTMPQAAMAPQMYTPGHLILETMRLLGTGRSTGLAFRSTKALRPDGSAETSPARQNRTLQVYSTYLDTARSQ